MTSINWQDLMNSSEGGDDFSALPADDYEVVITDSQAATASTGRNMLKCKFRVESGPYQNRTLFNNFVIVTDNENARRIFFRQMTALGLNKVYFDKDPTLEQVAEDLLDRRARVKVSVRQYGGQDRNQIDMVFPPTQSVQFSRSPGTPTPPPPPYSGEPPF